MSKVWQLAGLGLMCIKLRALLEPCCLRPFRGIACWLEAFQGGLPVGRDPSPGWAGEQGGDLTRPRLPASASEASSLARSVADACASLAIQSLCSASLGPVVSGSLSLICLNLQATVVYWMAVSALRKTGYRAKTITAPQLKSRPSNRGHCLQGMATCAMQCLPQHNMAEGTPLHDIRICAHLA